MDLLNLGKSNNIVIKQKKELVELFGYETRNKYSIETSDGAQIAYAAEQQKGVLGFLFRQFLGHWRTFDLNIYDVNRNLLICAKHPFRFFFQRLEVMSSDGRLLGAAQRRFSILTKSFDLENSAGSVLFTVRSPIWKLWTFPFKRHDQEMAVVKKKWVGMVKEAFTDADTFEVTFNNETLGDDEKLLVVVAGIYIDLMFFEAKAR